jgi:hypothetical protein
MMRRLLRDQSGQILPWVAILMTLLFAGLCALVVDIGRGILAYHMLQSATDAAVMAGAQLMPTATSDAAVTTRATLFSAVPGNNNANAAILPNASMVSGYPSFYCSSTVEGWGVLPNSSLAQSGAVSSAANCGTGANALVVAETVTIPMYFASWIGFPSMKLTAEATAAMKGSARQPYNVAVIIDTTASMGSTDGKTSNCSGTRVVCAETGVLTLLGDLSPCKYGLPCGTVTKGNVANPFDEVALYTFPGLTSTADMTADATAKSNCGNVVQSGWISDYGSTPVASMTSPETGPPYYQVDGFSSDYATANPTQVTTTGTSANLSSSSVLTEAAGLSSYCGLQAKGGASTYFAEVIYQAQADLVAQYNARLSAGQSTQNVMVILSDGDAEASTSDITGAGTSSVYPSYFNECQQAVTAAQAAYTATPSTTVYSVAYGTQSSGCSTDQSGYSVKITSGKTTTTYKNTNPSGLGPCQTMQNMASSSSTFFSDYVAGGNGGSNNTSCAGASGTDTSLNDIFSFIAGSLQTPRMMPNGTP